VPACSLPQILPHSPPALLQHLFSWLKDVNACTAAHSTARRHYLHRRAAQQGATARDVAPLQENARAGASSAPQLASRFLAVLAATPPRSIRTSLCAWFGTTGGLGAHHSHYYAPAIITTEQPSISWPLNDYLVQEGSMAWTCISIYRNMT